MCWRDPVSEKLQQASTLVALNALQHETMDGYLLSALECFTALDLEGGLAALCQFNEALQAHAAHEEQYMLPVFDGVGRQDGELPRGASIDILEGDHVSLARLSTRSHEAAIALDANRPDLRRQVVLMLPQIYRLRSVFEHHTVREQELVYPLLDRQLVADAHQRLLASLRQ